MEHTIQASLHNRLEKEPYRRAIAFYDNQGNFTWLTLEEFYKRALVYAAQLADHGLKKGEVCLLVLPSEEFSATLLVSVLLLGAVPLLIAPPVLQSEGAF